MTNSNNIKLAQNISQVAVIGFGIWLLCCLCCFSSSISSMLSVKSSLDNLPGKVVEGAYTTPVEIKDPDAEIFSVDSEITMYEQCNSNSKIIAAAAMNIGQALSSELHPDAIASLERNSINNTTFRDGTLANEKVRRIEVKNVEILPGSKWTVVEIGNHGEEGETTIVLDLPQSYEGNQTQLLNIGSECSDSTKSYIKYINLIYKPIKLDVKEKNEVEGYRI